MNVYRHLDNNEISSLEKNGCRAENWNDILVTDEFDPEQMLRVDFSGKILLDRNVRITDSRISDYRIGENAIVCNAGFIGMKGRSAFGIGTPVKVLNEAGGREVLLDLELSSQIAYFEAMYRHRKELVSKLHAMTETAAANSVSQYGRIGKNAVIKNTGTILDLNIGDNAVLEDCLRLENGTVSDAEPDSRVYIGAGAICRNFIACPGAEISDGAVLDTCFIGQCVKISKGFTATDSLFFANSHCENGEAAAVFAGPFTVSHHKSTLLIGGMYSYANAGSNTNFSNHLYKLGPVHHGIFGRGTKFGSGSYMMLPARTGAYTTVIGHHKIHLDSSAFPFSYLLEKEGRSYLVPGVNLTGAGLFRDLSKWQKRDRRNGERADILNSLSMTPYTSSRISQAIKILDDILSRQQYTKSLIEYNGFNMEVHAVSKGITRYENALIYYIGLRMLERLKGTRLNSDETLRNALIPDTAIGAGEWVDIAGLIAPIEEIDNLANCIEKGEILNFKEIRKRLESIHENFSLYEWRWLYDKIKEVFDTDPHSITRKKLVSVIGMWKSTAFGISSSIIADAKKEYSPSVNVGFGIDGNIECSEQEFLAVRGRLEDSSFYGEVEEMKSETVRLSDSIELSL